MKKEKATGWKIPLIFCAVIMALVIIGSFFKKPRENWPALPEELVARAQKISIDLDRDEQGRLWKELILDAGGGFYPPEVKDVKLAGVIEKAILSNRHDAACIAAALMKSADRRDKALESILDSAGGSCANLPWGVFAIRGIADERKAQELAARLEEKWNACSGVMVNEGKMFAQ